MARCNLKRVEKDRRVCRVCGRVYLGPRPIPRACAGRAARTENAVAAAVNELEVDLATVSAPPSQLPTVWAQWSARGDSWVRRGRLPPGYATDVPAFPPRPGERIRTPAFPPEEY